MAETNQPASETFQEVLLVFLHQTETIKKLQGNEANLIIQPHVWSQVLVRLIQKVLDESRFQFQVEYPNERKTNKDFSLLTFKMKNDLLIMIYD